MEETRSVRLEIVAQWDGAAAPGGEHATVDLELRPSGVEIRIDAPFHHDPPPPGRAGRTPGLWEYEVVEVFLLGSRERYLEVEVGPGGHWLGLELRGRRQVVRDDLAVEILSLERTTSRWICEARLETPLPKGPLRLNAYAIHGVGSARRYLAWHPVPGRTPDFHRIETFPTLDDAER